MSYFGIFMLIFAVCVLLVGLYVFNGHKISLLEWRVAFRNLNKSEWKNIGKWTMISSIFIFLIAIIALVFDI